MNHVAVDSAEPEQSKQNGESPLGGEVDGASALHVAANTNGSDEGNSINVIINTSNNNDVKVLETQASSTSSSAKVNFSLSKKKKKKKVNPNITGFQGRNGDDNDDEGTDIAAAAQVETERRAKEGVKLVIPLLGGRDESAPILQGLRDIIHDKKETKTELLEGKDGTDDKVDETFDAKVKYNEKMDVDADAIAEKALLEEASRHHEDKTKNDTDQTNYSAKGSLVIATTGQHENGGTNSNVKDRIQTLRGDKGGGPTGSRGGRKETLDDTIKYQRDLAQRAENISVDSSAYVSVPIAEFGAAMLRGMGWKGSNDGTNNNSSNNSKKNLDTTITPRPHRLGLGATPLAPSLQAGGLGTGANGKRHRARKGGAMADRAHIEKEEEAERKWKAHLEERKKKDLQLTLQVGSIVHVESGGERGANGSRAKLIQLSGVPGLNRVLVQYEYDRDNTSVKKGDIVLVDKAELEERPFEDRGSDNECRSRDKISSNIRQDKNDTTGSNSRSPSRGRDRKRKRKEIESKESRSDDRHGRRESSRRHRSRSRSRDRYTRDSGENRDGDRRRDYYDRDDKHKSSRHRHSRSRSPDRYDEERGRERRRDRDRDRHRERHRDREDDRRRRKERDRGSDRDRDLIDRHRSRGEGNDRDKKYSKASQSHGNDRESDHKHWLIPNIRVRVVTKKIARGRQFKEKGIVVDVLRRGSEATLKMNNGELIERIKERDLETALPKVGGNVIILIGKNKLEKGKLLERNSESGQGIVQLFEDMHVLSLSLDDIAEYCGPLDDTLAADY